MTNALSFELSTGLFCQLGRAVSALGRKADALLVWEQGYAHAQHQSADLKLLLELEELLTTAKQGNIALSETNGWPTPQSESDALSNGSLTEIGENQDRLSAQAELCDNTSDKSAILPKSADDFDSRNELSSEDRESNKSDKQVNGSPDVIDKLSYNSESCNDSSDTSESCDKDKVFTDRGESSSDSSEIAEILRKPSSKFIFPYEKNGDARKNKKFCVARISKTKSISVDFGLSRGIAEVCMHNCCVAVFVCLIAY